MTKTILIVSVLLVLFDIFIYRSVVSKSKSKLLRVTFCFQAGLVYFIPIIFIFFRELMMVREVWMSTVAWFIFFLVTAFSVKIVISTFLAMRWVARKINPKRKFQGFVIVGYTLGFSVLSFMMWGNIFGRTQLRVEHITITSDKLPESFDGFKIAHFSDTHIGNYGTWHKLLIKLVEQINEQKPDLVVQTGDLVNIQARELTDELMALLGSIEAPVYSVLGNHDLGYYIGDIDYITPEESLKLLLEKQAQMGWMLLDNQREWIHRSGDSILIGGTTFPSDHHHNGNRLRIGESNLPKVMNGVSDSVYSIMLSHTPVLFDSVYTNDVTMPELMLSGHTHAMQTKIGDWSPAEMIYDKYSGLYENEQGRKLYINDGLGYVVMPFRFGTNPELTIITLKNE